MKKSVYYLLICSLVYSCTNISKKNIYCEIGNEYTISKQVFYINPARDTILKCKYGTMIFIKENSLCYDNTESINFMDNVSIEIMEYQSLPNMMLNNLTTISDNKIIETGGMLNIIAKSKSRNVILKTSESIHIVFPSKPKAFTPFYSNAEKNQQINWIEGIPNPCPPAVIDTSLFLGDSTKWNKNDKRINMLSFNKLGWINCDRFLNFDDTAEIFVKTQEDMDSSTFCSVILKNYNSIIPGKITQNNSMKFSPIPIGETVTLFLISYKDDSYYMGVKDVIVKSKETYIVNMEPVSKEQLKARIEEFDKERIL